MKKNTSVIKKYIEDEIPRHDHYVEPIVQVPLLVRETLSASEVERLKQQSLSEYKQAKQALEICIADIATHDEQALIFAGELSERILTLMEIAVELNFIKQDEVSIEPEHLVRLGISKEAIAKREKNLLVELKKKNIKTKIISEIGANSATDFGNRSEAGFVGFSPLAIENATQGNLRERMYIAYKATHGFTKNLFLNSNQVTKINQALKNKGFDWQLNEKAINFFKEHTHGKQDGLYTYGAYATSREGSRVTKTEQERMQYITQKSPMIREMESARMPLSQRELLAQTGDLNTHHSDQKIQWLPGEAHAKVLDSREHPTLKAADATSDLMLTGISGTTDAILTLGHMIGMFNTNHAEEQKKKMHDALIACIGWMVDARDHTTHEILVSGKSFGLDYIPGPASYKYIRPGDDAFLTKLRQAQAARGFKMPDEYLSQEHLLEISEPKMTPTHTLVDSTTASKANLAADNSEEKIIALMRNHKFSPTHVVASNPSNIAIVQAAYEQDPAAIKAADKDVINELGVAGRISQEDVVAIFSMIKPGVDGELPLASDFVQAKAVGDWATVAEICQSFWFEKPPEANRKAVLEELTKKQQWESLYQFESAFQPAEHEATYGPFPKSDETFQLEALMRKMLHDGNFKVEQREDGDYFVFNDGAAFNWTNIREKANFQHIELNQKDFAAYKAYSPSSDSEHFSTLKPGRIKKYRNALYKQYDAQGKARPEPQISFEEMQAINIYSGAAYSEMNGLMRDETRKFDYRHKPPQEIREILLYCMMCASGLRKIPETDIPYSYRGASFGTPNEQQARILAAANQGIVQLDGFVSSGIISGQFSKEITYTFKHLRGAYIEAISQHPGEKEFLIPPTQVQITGYKQKGYVSYFDACLVEDAAPTLSPREQLPNIMTSSWDFNNVMRPRTPEHRARLFDAMKTGLPDIILSGQDFGHAMQYLADDQRTELYIAMKSDLQNLIQSADDFNAVMNFLSIEQRTMIYEATKNRLPDLIQSAQDVNAVMNFLSIEQRTTIYEAIKNRLPALLQSAYDFNTVMNKLSPEQTEVLLNAIKNRLPALLQSAYDFNTVMNKLSPEQTEVLLNAIKNRLPTLIQSVNDLHTVMNYLSIEQCTALYEAMKDRLPTLIQSINDFNRVMYGLSPEQRTALYETIKDHLPTLIQSLKDFNTVMSKLSPKQRAALYEAMKDRLPTLIQSIFDFDNVMNYLSIEQRTALYEAMKDRLPTLIQSVNDFNRAMYGLSPEQRTALYETIKDRLPTLIKSVNDFADMMYYLSIEQIAAFSNAIKDRLPTLIQSTADINSMQSRLSPERFTVLLAAMKDILPTITPKQRTVFFNLIKDQLHNVIDSGVDFGHTLYSLTPAQRTVVFNNIQHNLPSIIRSSVDFGYALRYLEPEQRTLIFEGMKNTLPDMIKTGEDIYYALINLTREQRTVILDNINNLPSIFTSAKDFGLAISYLNHGEDADPAFIMQAHDIIMKHDVAWVQEMLSTCKNTDTVIIETMYTASSENKNLAMAQILGKEVAKNLIKNMELEKMLRQLKVPKNSIDDAISTILDKTMADMTEDNLSSYTKTEVRSSLLKNLQALVFDKNSDLGKKIQHRKHPKLDKLLSQVHLHIAPKKFTDFKNRFNKLMPNEELPNQDDKKRDTGPGRS
ncbi:MAG: ADP-ribosyltransferase [Legionellaceae bacterium]|nr:ADP-ribosyltransferase [Legionellaceae bacterium]